MNTVFAIKNQHGLYLSKQKEWVNGSDAQSLFRTPHKDEAINTVFEVSSHDIYLRAEVFTCELDAKGNPDVEVSAELPPATSDESSDESLPA